MREERNKLTRDRFLLALVAEIYPGLDLQKFIPKRVVVAAYVVPDLSPCPFCESPAVFKEQPGQAGFNDYPPSVWVECSRCHSKGEEVSLMGTALENNKVKDKVVGKWNTRR